MQHNIVKLKTAF